MWEIDETFDYVLGRNGKGHINLNPDKGLTPFDLKPPVTWKGFVNEYKVKLTWKGGSFGDEKNYEKNIFPIEVNDLFSLVIKKIDEYYKYLD